MMVGAAVNWQAIGSIIAGIGICLSIIVVPLLRWVFKGAGDDLVDRRIAPRFDTLEAELTEIRRTVQDHGTRITRLEGIEEGKQQALKQMRP